MRPPRKLWFRAMEATKRHKSVGKVALVVVAVLVVIVGLARLDYRYGWTEFGAYRHPTSGKILWGKTLWDWLDLLIVPAVLAVGGLLFSQSERRAERRIAEDRTKAEREAAADRMRETTLQGYLDKMTELLLEKGLRESEPDAEVRIIARARTLTALRALDGERKGILLRFLYEMGLINDKVIVDLQGADLSGVDLSRAELIGVTLGWSDLDEVWARLEILRPGTISRTDLSEADLSGANLSGATLYYVDLSKANLGWADLSSSRLNWASLKEAMLYNADLYDADLRKTDLTEADLTQANLKGIDLREAKLVDTGLREVILWEANLQGANLHKANLQGADLWDTYLQGADLHEANLQGAELRDVKLDEHTILPDSTKWTPDTDMSRFTDPAHPDFWRSDDPTSPAYRGKDSD